MRAAAFASSGQITEGFHYRHHPVNLRLRDLVTSGALGDIRRVDLVLTTPAPPAADPRWSLELAGGATMDLGCYVLDAAHQLGDWIGTSPQIVVVDARLWAPEVDASMRVQLAYAGGVTGHCTWEMDAAKRTMTWTVTGTEGSATSAAFSIPHMDNRLLLTRNGRTSQEVLGDQTSLYLSARAYRRRPARRAALPGQHQRISGQRRPDRPVLPPGWTITARQVAATNTNHQRKPIATGSDIRLRSCPSTPTQLTGSGAVVMS